MPHEFRIVRRVEFAETDLAGILHYSNFFRYMEAAEHAFFRSLGFSIAPRDGPAPVAWPRVHAQCDFKHPLRFEDEVEIHLRVEEKRTRALRYGFRFRRLQPAPAIEVARGSLTAVCVVRQPDGGMKAVPIPPEIAARIEEAPPEPEA